MQLQSWGTTAEDLFAVGEQLARIDARVVVKLPITRAGAAAAARLVAGGTRVTLTGGCAHRAQIARRSNPAAFQMRNLPRHT